MMRKIPRRIGKGSRIGEYTVMSPIGGGRYGVCFLARDDEGRKVVLKRFRGYLSAKKRCRTAEMRREEAVSLSLLSHPGIPEILGVINDRNGYFFVLEYMEGKTLEDWLFRERKEFSPAEIYDIGSQMFGIMGHMHARGFVHGDISISNVIYDGEKVSLIDFGLAGRARDGSRTGSRAHGVSRDLDYARTADVLIYLLYSGYRGKGRRTWCEELPLTEDQKAFLEELIDPAGMEGKPGGCDGAQYAEKVAAGFAKAWGRE